MKNGYQGKRNENYSGNFQPDGNFKLHSKNAKFVKGWEIKLKENARLIDILLARLHSAFFGNMRAVAFPICGPTYPYNAEESPRPQNLNNQMD